MSVDLYGFGHAESEAVTGNKTLAITDQGDVQNVTASATITLPATVVGYVFIVRIGAMGLTVNISPAAADLIAGAGFTAADNKDLTFTNQPAGSYIALVGNGTTGWNILSRRGTITQEA